MQQPVVPFVPGFSLLDFFGVGVAAISGVLTAGHRRMDLFGVFVVAVATAIGGGTIRDVLLNRFPIFWIAHPVYLAVIAVCMIATVIYTHFVLPSDRVLLFADAIALGLFTIAGAQIGELRHIPVSSVVVMATLTGVGGGILRDVLTREFPLVLRQDIYATAAIFGAIVYVTCRHWGLASYPSAIIGMSIVIGIRFFVILRRVDLPIFTIGATHSKFEAADKSGESRNDR